MPSARTAPMIVVMDILAVAIGLVCFALLLMTIEALDRI